MRKIWSDIEVVAETQHGAVGRWQLTELGLHNAARRRAVVQRRLVALLPCAFALAGTPESWLRSASACVLDAGRDTLLGHATAASLHNFDGFRRDRTDCVDVVTKRGTSSRHRAYRLHLTNLPLPPDDRTVVEGIACTTKVRTVIDLASTMTDHPWRCERLVDMAFRDGHCTERELRTRLAAWRHRGTAGAHVLDEVLGDEDLGRTESEAERKFLKILRAWDLPDPCSQFEIRDGARFVGRADFCWPDASLVVEIDGHRFHSTREQRRHDATRRREISALGYDVWVYEAGEVFNDRGQIAGALRLRTNLVSECAEK